jgi:TonB family protein
MKTGKSIKIICSLIWFLTITACSTSQEKTSLPERSTDTETDSVQHSSETSEPDYVLPEENVLIYRQYTMEDLAQKSPSGGGMLDNDLVPIVINLPLYPASALSNKEQGDVIVEFTAPTMGKIKQIKIISAPSNQDFQRAALESLHEWVFAAPKIRNTKYTVTNIKLKIEFRIENGNPVCYFKDETNTSGFYPPGPISIKTY